MVTVPDGKVMPKMYMTRKKGESMRRFSAFLVVMLCLLAGTAWAGGEKSDFIFGKMKSYTLSDQQIKDYDALTVKMPKAESTEYEEKTFEGKYVRTQYRFSAEGIEPSTLQVLRTYENAVTKLGGTILYKTDYMFDAQFTKDGKEYYMALNVYDNGATVDIKIVEPAELEEVLDILDSNAIVEALQTKGQISLYINFDSGKATIKPDSKSVIDEVVKALQSQPDLKVKVEGHTDNVGNEAANQQLSEDRAKAVMEAVVAAGVDPSRLSSAGFGMSKPIADNNTEEGRAQNRRVELVRQ